MVNKWIFVCPSLMKHLKRRDSRNIPSNTWREKEGYCLKSRTKREIKGSQQVTLKNGKPATKGVCPVCGPPFTALARDGSLRELEKLQLVAIGAVALAQRWCRFIAKKDGKEGFQD